MEKQNLVSDLPIILLWTSLLASTLPFHTFFIAFNETLEHGNEYTRSRRLRGFIVGSIQMEQPEPTSGHPTKSHSAIHLNEANEENAKIWTQLTFSAEYDLLLAPHTIKHYIDAGLDRHNFLISLHHSNLDASDELNRMASKIRTEFGIQNIQTWSGNFTSQENRDMRIRQRRDSGVQECDWVLKFDADEFLRVPGNNFPEFLASLDDNYDALYGTMVDRVSTTGFLPEFSNTSSISDQFPLECAITQAGNATTTKVVGFRGYLTEFRAGHGLVYGQDSCRYPLQLVIDHYKWSSSVLTKLKRRIEHYRWLEANGNGHHWWRESEAFLRHIHSSNNHIDVGNKRFQCAKAGNNQIDHSFFRIGGPEENSSCTRRAPICPIGR